MATHTWQCLTAAVSQSVTTLDVAADLMLSPSRGPLGRTPRRRRSLCRRHGRIPAGPTTSRYIDRFTAAAGTTWRMANQPDGRAVWTTTTIYGGVQSTTRRRPSWLRDLPRLTDHISLSRGAVNDSPCCFALCYSIILSLLVLSCSHTCDLTTSRSRSTTGRTCSFCLSCCWLAGPLVGLVDLLTEQNTPPT